MTVDPAAPPAWYSFDIKLDLEARTLSGTFIEPSGSVPFGPFTLDTRFLTSPKVALHPGLSFASKNAPATKIRTDNITVDYPP